MVEYFKSDQLFEADELDSQKIKALDDGTRQEILKLLAEDPGYPSELAEKLSISKQKAYYHFQKLEDAGLLQKDRSENVSGGQATYYEPTADGYILDLGRDGRPFHLPERKGPVVEFLHPLVDEGELNGKIVVGSPDQHGPDQVRARDGHLSGEVALKLGKYTESSDKLVKLDTEVVRDDEFDDNFLLLGGILTNTLTKKFNEAFPAKFSGDEFPYREISTPESTYTEDSIGLVAKARHPEKRGKNIFMVAGIRNQGTEAAVRAFKNLEGLIEGYEGG
ncbi:MAG: helix-turn-helix domain-containing protein, partial [Candidatus Nanohalobium sp.]